jgi:hypothetical protein
MESRADEIEQGWNARGRDGEKIGEIEEVGVTHLLVSRGVLAPPDLYVPMDAVSAVDRERGSVTLSVDSGDVDDQGWAQPPSPETLAPDAGVDGLGYTGREPGDNAPSLAEDGVEGLGFTGRDDAGDIDGDREDASRD